MNNREVALSLAAAGIAIFPCAVDKRPERGIFWRRASTADAAQIERWWTQWPEALPGIDLGKAGLLAIDGDTPKLAGQADGVTAFVAIAGEQGDDLATVPMVRTPSGGMHWYVRNVDPPLGNGRGALPPKPACGIDVRGVGGFVIAPEATLPDGRRYVAAGSILDAPPMPGWLETLLRGKREERLDATPAPTPPPRPAPSSGQIARLEAYGAAGLDEEIRRLRSTPKGGRNNALNEAAFSIGTLVGAGWVSEATASSQLEAAAADIGLARDDSWRSVRATIRSGLGAGMARPRQKPPDMAEDHNGAEIARRLIAAADGTIIDEETGEVVADAPAAAARPARKKTPAVGEMPERLRQAPGLVGDIAAWIMASARRPQPALSIGAALTIVGTAAGRQVAGPTLLPTHLYVVGLAPTGSGKDHPLQSISRIMRAAKLSQHLGPSEFISMPAVIRFLQRAPLSVCAMDEFGAFIKRINSRRASGFEAAISKILRTAWGTAFGTLTTPEWAGRAAEDIASPAMSIFGASTAEEFYGALEGADQDNGVLNRFLLVSTSERPAERKPSVDPLSVPRTLIEDIRFIYMMSGEVAASLRNASQLEQLDPLKMTWGNDGAEDLYAAFGTEIEERTDSDPLSRSFLVRTVDMALRVASIVAIGQRKGTVDAEDFEYGRDLALWSAETMMRGAREYMADTDTQAEANRIVRMLRLHGGRMQRRDLLKGLQYRMKARDLNQLIDAMVEAGSIEKFELPAGEAGGRPGTGYMLTPA